MSYAKYTVPLFAAILLAGSTAAAKKLPPPPLGPPHVLAPPVNDDFVHRQFGENCSLLQGPAQFVADLDDDGIDDLILVARCTNPMADRDEHNFIVADPYNNSLGFGDVKVTSTFASDDPERRGISLLIIHGSSNGGFQSPTPKAKFVLINLPFKNLAVKRITVHKHKLLGIFMEEHGEGENTSSVVFWDGRKYHYQILGASLD